MFLSLYKMGRQYMRQTLACIVADDSICTVKVSPQRQYAAGRQYVPRVSAYVVAEDNMLLGNNICRHTPTFLKIQNGLHACTMTPHSAFEVILESS